MGETVTAQVIEYVMGEMFLVLPELFLVAMSWAGYSIGNSLEGMLGGASKAAPGAAGKGTDQLMDATKKHVIR